MRRGLAVGTVALCGALLASTAVAALSCVGDDGKSVDWWAALKYPSVPSYDYIDAEAPSPWAASGKKINDKTTGALAHTVSQMFKDGVSYATWNDKPDGSSEVSSIFAHSKGIILADESGAVYLAHSVPQFPLKGYSYNGYPDSGLMYGQSFLCVTVSLSDLNTLGTLLLYNRPYFSWYNVSDAVRAAAPNFADAVINWNYVGGSNSTSVSFKTAGGVPLVAFAKTGGWGKDLYNSLVGPSLKDDTLAETWQNDADALGNACSPPHTYSTMNIDSVTLPETSWTNPSDHAKWTVTKHKPYACVGDINREQSQYGRGGGTLCLNSPDAWKSFSSAVGGVYSTPPKGACTS